MHKTICDTSKVVTGGFFRFCQEIVNDLEEQVDQVGFLPTQPKTLLRSIVFFSKFFIFGKKIFVKLLFSFLHPHPVKIITLSRKHVCFAEIFQFYISFSHIFFTFLKVSYFVWFMKCFVQCRFCFRVNSFD